MRREIHRRRGVYRRSSGGWGHRAVYIGALVASAAMVAGFGAALLVYGPLGSPSHQLIGSNLNTPPKGVTFGNASVVFASNLKLTNATGGNWTWNFTNATGSFNGPCNQSGIYGLNGTGIYLYGDNNSSIYNLTGNTTLVCLNSINNGQLNATWYWSQNGTTRYVFNNYTAEGVPNGSYFNNTVVNVSSCSNFTLFHGLNNTTFNGSYIPCQTYFEMNNDTVWLPTYSNATYANGTAPPYGNSTILWSPNQTGYDPSDLIYQLPVYFSNATTGAYEISVALEGVTPVAQTFLFNYSAAAANNSTVLFTFDLTSAWLMDLASTYHNATYNITEMAIYGSINVVSAIVTECAQTAAGEPVCPIATPVDWG